MKTRSLVAAVMAVGLLAVPVPASAGSSAGAEADLAHPCHEHWPEGGTGIVKWAEFHGYDFAYCMVKEAIG